MHILFSFLLNNNSIIYQIGIFALYQNGIIMSRDFAEKGRKDGIPFEGLAKKPQNIPVEACP